MKLKANGEPVALYYGWVCDADFQRGNFAETTISRAFWRPCIVCGGDGGHQVSAATIARIFDILDKAAPEQP